MQRKPGSGKSQICGKNNTAVRSQNDGLRHGFLQHFTVRSVMELATWCDTELSRANADNCWGRPVKIGDGPHDRSPLANHPRYSLIDRQVADAASGEFDCVPDVWSPSIHSAPRQPRPWGFHQPQNARILATCRAQIHSAPVAMHDESGIAIAHCRWVLHPEQSMHQRSAEVIQRLLNLPPLLDDGFAFVDDPELCFW